MLLTDFMKHVSNRIWEETLTHTVAHTAGSQRLCRLLPAHAPWIQRNARKDPKSTGEKLLPFRCSACLRDLSNLRHEAAHFLRGLLLHLPCDVGVGAEGEARVVVPEHTADDILKQIRN